MIDCWPGGKEGTDYVECKLCQFAGNRIVIHVKKEHGLNKESYVAVHGPVICAVTSAIHGSTGNFDWIRRANERGDDLSSYKEKMGRAVQRAILENPNERSRRSDVARRSIVPWAKSDAGRKKSSDTAKETSARPEILKVRSEKLAAWRARDPEAFYEKCVAGMLNTWQSKPELWLRNYVSVKYPDMGFKGNQLLRSNKHFLINSSHIRQIDIMSKSHKVLIEVDGHLHFHNVENWNQLEGVQAKDKELDEACPKMGYMLIRISDDQWHPKTGELDEDAIGLLDMYLQAITPRVIRIGDKYSKSS